MVALTPLELSWVVGREVKVALSWGCCGMLAPGPVYLSIGCFVVHFLQLVSSDVVG